MTILGFIIIAVAVVGAQAFSSLKELFFPKKKKALEWYDTDDTWKDDYYY